MAFNLWKYEIERIELEEGGWQGRIISELSENDIKKIQQFKNVERAELNEDLSDEKTVIDIYFKNLRTIYSDMPGIARYLGVEEEEIQYHVQLLSCYFITDPQDKEPPLLLPFCAVVLFFICLSLILIIRNSFEISMNFVLPLIYSYFRYLLLLLNFLEIKSYVHTHLMHLLLRLFFLLLLYLLSILLS